VTPNRFYFTYDYFATLEDYDYQENVILMCTTSISSQVHHSHSLTLASHSKEYQDFKTEEKLPFFKLGPNFIAE
jgi:hypothetical protein